MARGCTALLHQAGAPRVLSTEATTLISEVKNRTKRKIDDTMVEPLLLELRGNDETVEILPEQDRVLAPVGMSSDCATTSGARRQTLDSRDHGCLSGLRSNNRERNSSWCVGR